MFKKFIQIYKMKFGNLSHREKLEIYNNQLDKLKPKLINAINEKSYEDISLILNTHRKIETNVTLISFDYTLNRGHRITEEFYKNYNFQEIIMEHIKNNKDSELLNFLKSRDYSFVKGFHIKGVSRRFG
jgi:hypothetical protein